MIYLPEMPKIDTKVVLWNNVSTRMNALYGKENLSRLVKDCGIGPGTATRLKEQQTSVGVDVLVKLGDALKVEPWQLLHPDLGKASQTANEKNPPTTTLTEALRVLAVALDDADTLSRAQAEPLLLHLCKNPGDVDRVISQLLLALEPVTHFGNDR